MVEIEQMRFEVFTRPLFIQGRAHADIGNALMMKRITDTSRLHGIDAEFGTQIAVERDIGRRHADGPATLSHHGSSMPAIDQSAAEQTVGAYQGRPAAATTREWPRMKRHGSATSRKGTISLTLMPRGVSHSVRFLHIAGATIAKGKIESSDDMLRAHCLTKICSTKSSADNCANACVKSKTTTSSMPQALSSRSLADGGVRRKGGRSGLKNARGCGSNVRTCAGSPERARLRHGFIDGLDGRDARRRNCPMQTRRPAFFPSLITCDLISLLTTFFATLCPSISCPTTFSRFATAASCAMRVSSPHPPRAVLF